MSIDWKSRIRLAFASAGEQAIDQDIVEELSAHAQSAYQTARSNSCTHDEAVQTVDELIGQWVNDAPHMKRRPRRSSLAETPPETTALLPGFMQEIRYAVRLLRKQPVYAAAVILIMALGIGATTTLFSVAYGVLFKPLPWPQADRLVRLQETRPGATRGRAWTVTNASFLAWREHHSTVDDIAGWSLRAATLTGSGTATWLSYVAVTSNLFSMLGANPIQGSVFHPEDEIATPNVIVLSYGLWQQEFGGAPDAVGKTIRLDDKPYTVIGVMGPTFVFPDRESRAWIPLYVLPPVTGETKRTVQLVNAIARLHTVATPAAAAAEATTSARGAPDLGMSAVAMFGTDTPPQISAMPALDAITAEVRPAIIVFLVAVGLLLLTATANVASLQLARSTVRAREVAIRAAIGASTARLTRQLVTESLLLGLIGGITGLALVAALQTVLPALLPANFPRISDIGLNLPVVFFAATITVGTAVTCGVWPALHLSAVNVTESLTEHGAERMSSGRTTQRTQALVMTGQIAIACVLLSGATLLAKSFWRMLHADRGYDTTNLMTANVTMTPATFTAARRAAIVNAVLGRLMVAPGVVHAAFTDSLQFAGETLWMTSFKIPGTNDRPTIMASALSHTVSLQYFPTMGIRLIEGRPFMATDNANSQPVMLVNRTFQRQYLKDRTVGAMLPCSVSAEDRDCEVIGVVEDVHRNYDDSFQAERFFLDQQLTPPPFIGTYVTFIARTSSDPNLLINEFKSIVHDEDSSLAIDSILSMEDRVSGSLTKPRLYAVLLGGFALFSLMIAATGLFGVLSYTVAQRSAELALRVALGARHADVIQLVAGQALWITFGGLLAGAGLTLASVKYLSSFLYGVTTRDTFTFVSVPLIVTLMAATACLIPAIRAIRSNPLEAMRGASGTDR